MLIWRENQRSEAAFLYIDGKRLPIGTTVSANRGQQLVAAAPSCYGEVGELSASDTKITVSLQPLTLLGSNQAHKLRELACSLDDAPCDLGVLQIRSAISATQAANSIT